MQLFQFGPQDVTAAENEGQEPEQKSECKTLQRPSGVKPFCEQVQESDHSTNFLKRKKSLDEHLRRSPGIGTGQKTKHFLREEGRGSHERKKNQRPKPNRCIQHADKSQ